MPRTRLGRPRTRPDRVRATRRTRPERTATTGADTGSAAASRTSPIRPAPVRSSAPATDVHRSSTRPTTDRHAFECGDQPPQEAPGCGYPFRETCRPLRSGRPHRSHQRMAATSTVATDPNGGLIVIHRCSGPSPPSSVSVVQASARSAVRRRAGRCLGGRGRARPGAACGGIRPCQRERE